MAIKGNAIKTVYGILEKIVIIAIILISAIILTQRFTDNEKAFLGFRILRVQTGSMEPKYHVGDVIIVKEKNTDKILSVIIEKNIALEVNTSSFYALGDFFPSKDILKQYHKMGGFLITMGSDAHVAENASVQFEKALQTVREIGFDKMYYYKKRKPIAYEI